MMLCITAVECCAACGSILENGNENFCPYCGQSLSKAQSFTIDYSIPVNMKYEEVTKIEIQNPSSVRVSGATLEFCPYYVFDYKMKMMRKDPTGKNHKIESEGKHIVNAQTGELVSAKPTTEFKNSLSKLIGYRKENTDESHRESDVERYQIVGDLKNILPIYNQIFNLTSEYRLDIIQNEVTLKGSEKTVLRKIKEDNITEISYTEKKDKGRTREKMKITPTYNEIKLKRELLIYVPIWIIKFKSGNMSYTRRSLAASRTSVLDEISYCPKHFSFGKVISIKKQTYAICEECGGAFCADHIFRVNESYYCEEHRAI
jgi:hypothetical protein